MNLVLANDRKVQEWVCERTGAKVSHQLCKTLAGYVEDRLIAALAFFNHHPALNIEVAAAAEPGAIWLTRGSLRKGFSYAFVDLGVKRLTARVRAGNERSIRLIEALGFTREGYVRHGFHDDDMVIYGMLRDECRWLGEDL